MSTARRIGGPYRQRLNEDPPPPPPTTRRWFVASGALVAVALAKSPPLVPLTVAHAVDMRPVAMPYRVLRFEDEEVDTLRDAVAFEGSSADGLLVVRANGEAYQLAEHGDHEREVATRVYRPRTWVTDATSVLGVAVYREGAHVCLLLDARTEECAAGQRTSILAHRSAQQWGWETWDTACRIERGFALCRRGVASGRVLHRRRPAPIAGDLRFVALGAVASTTCGATRDGAVRCWGPSLRAIPGVSDARSVTLRPDLGCALREGGAVSCWPMGEAAHGAVVATAVEGVPPAREIAANATATCALDAAGTVRCWGSFGRAWPGHPRAYTATRPLDVRLPEPATALVSTTGFDMCARLRSGELRCWGGPADAWGERRPIETLGDTATDETWAVRERDFDADTTMLDDGRVVVKDDRTPQGWSVLGDLPRARALVAGSSHHCALAADGRAWCWGDNTVGQLGLDDAARDDAWTVVQVARE
jgi:hypothetical protein